MWYCVWSVECGEMYDAVSHVWHKVSEIWCDIYISSNIKYVLCGKRRVNLIFFFFFFGLESLVIFSVWLLIVELQISWWKYHHHNCCHCSHYNIRYLKLLLLLSTLKAKQKMNKISKQRTECQKRKTTKSMNNKCSFFLVMSCFQIMRILSLASSE